MAWGASGGNPVKLGGPLSEDYSLKKREKVTASNSKEGIFKVKNCKKGKMWNHLTTKR